MNDHLARMKELDRQIHDVNVLINRGDYRAAGLSIEITVGQDNDGRGPDLQVQLGIASGAEEVILYKIKGGLEATYEWHKREAHRDLRELQDFFKTEILS